jgi:hypothetical protein
MDSEVSRLAIQKADSYLGIAILYFLSRIHDMLGHILDAIHAVPDDLHHYDGK